LGAAAIAIIAACSALWIARRAAHLDPALTLRAE